MRIRTQLLFSAVLTGAVVLGLWAALAHVTAQASAGLDEQAEAQQVALEVANMLSLTNEFAVYGGERSAGQWRSRQEQLSADVVRAIERRSPPSAQLLELQQSIGNLPALFNTLVQIGQIPPSPFTQRRKDLMVERLLTETREVVEARHRWALAVGQQQRRDQRQYTAIVLAAPAALLLILVSLGWLISRRVLKPLAVLESTVGAIRDGDLTVRCASSAADELGDAARAVDAMALTLQQQSAALRASEQHLRLVADSLPARVAHIDADERYTFVNAHIGRVFGVDPTSILGQTLRAMRGEIRYADIAPHVQQALSGETVTFEGSALVKGSVRHHQSTFVPDIDDAGKVRGFIAMTFDITARKQAELQQAASEQRLIDITDNLPALVGYVDSEHRYRFSNANYRHWLGVDPSRMIGELVPDVLGAKVYAAVQPYIARALAGERVQWTGTGRRAGQPAHFLAEYIPDRGPDGSIRGCYALTIDITDRRRAELEAARNQQRMFDLTNSLPAMVGYFDMSERCQYANDTALRSQGIERSALPNLTLRAALGESNYALHEPYVKEVLEGGRARLEGKIAFEGRDAHFQAHLIPDRVDGGAQRGFYLMTFDITALKEAQQRQARVERQLRAITDNLPVLISYIDKDERFRFINATSKAWLGIDPPDAIGQKITEVTSPRFHEPRLPHIREALTGKRATFETQTLVGGQLRHTQTVYIPDIQSNGRVDGLYAISTDVTPMKEIEQRLSELAHIDALTGLANRRQLNLRLPESIARSRRNGQPIALMFLDVDHFKSINDRLGHAAGDLVLKEFADRLKAAIRITDLAVRLAGDEFVVLLDGVHSGAEAALVAKKLVSTMREPFMLNSAPLQVTTSVGVAYCERPLSDSALMEKADEALYGAKGAGRNCFQLCTLCHPADVQIPAAALGC